MKNINLLARANCNELQVVNYSTVGLKAPGVYKQIQAFRKDHCSASAKSIIIHVRTNHLPRDNLVDVVNKICSLMVHLSYEFPNTSIHFLAIPPKFVFHSFFQKF